MIRTTEIELHAKAQKLLDDENSSRFWRLSTEFRAHRFAAVRIAGLIERQAILARVREQMRIDGVSFTTEENPPSELLGG